MQNQEAQNKISVVQIIDRLNTGGTEKVLITLANLLYKHGHETTVITTVFPGTLASLLNKNIPFINLKRKWKWNPLTMHRLVCAIKKFDVIHVHSSYNPRYVFIAMKLFGLKKKIFFHEHFGDINIDQQVKWHAKFIFPKTIFIAVSQQIADWAQHAVKVPQKNIYVLPNIVVKQNAAAGFENNNMVNIVVVSNIRPSKNIEFALQVFESIEKNSTQQFHLTIVGNVADAAYNTQIKNIISEKNIADKISFVHDCISVQEILPHFSFAMHTAVSESGPLVLIEYLAQQIPFLTYSTGQVVQQIKSDLPQFILHSFNVNDWVNAFNNLMHQDQLLLKQKLEKVFQKNYAEENYYNQCINIYKKGLQ